MHPRGVLSDDDSPDCPVLEGRSDIGESRGGSSVDDIGSGLMSVVRRGVSSRTGGGTAYCFFFSSDISVDMLEIS